MNIGDLVIWPAGYCEEPGLVLDKMPSKAITRHDKEPYPTPSAISFGSGYAVLVMLPELNNEPEWFHERELEVVCESK